MAVFIQTLHTETLDHRQAMANWLVERTAECHWREYSSELGHRWNYALRRRARMTYVFSLCDVAYSSGMVFDQPRLSSG